MNDIVKRLRELTYGCIERDVWDHEATTEAADEIERLRGLLRECEPAVYSQHMVAIGTRIAKPTTLLARVRAEIERTSDQQPEATDPTADVHK